MLPSLVCTLVLVSLKCGTQLITMMQDKPENPWQILLIFLRLGLTSFGGPAAHLGYFRTEFVERRKWLSEKDYADLMALCQFLPGPASSQVGLAIGIMKAGYRGALAAWLGFTLPSAIVLILFAYGSSLTDSASLNGMLSGLKVVAVGVVAHAVWGMAQSLCRGAVEIVLALVSTVLLLTLSGALMQIMVIVLSGICGWLLIKQDFGQNKSVDSVFGDTSLYCTSPKYGVFFLVIFAVLLASLPLLSAVTQSETLGLGDSFYRVGALVFGGGHVVLPLLQAEVVDVGLVSQESFFAGYGATQAVPGPLFTFAAYLGAVNSSEITGVLGALVCLLAIFLPAFLLVAGTLPIWAQVRKNLAMQSALAGVNACVVGILLAALIGPLWSTAIVGPIEFVMAVVVFISLAFLKTPPWLVVLAGSLSGLLLLSH